LGGFLPQDYGTYYEPMVGSGALFFAVAPSTAVVADINCELIEFYRVVRREPRKLHALLDRSPVNKATYYSIRARRPENPLARAARFFYLIRLSWNGLYRVNQMGEFNVPYGGRRPHQLLELERAIAAAKVLRSTRLICGDFQQTTMGARRGDFVYFDPPYPKGSTNGNGFARYSATGFTLTDHARLASHATRLADRGVFVMITEAARKELLSLFPRDFHVTLVRNPSLIAADALQRRDAYEAILTSYRVRDTS
jgi:DNA adenine methylase